MPRARRPREPRDPTAARVPRAPRAQRAKPIKPVPDPPKFEAKPDLTIVTEKYDFGKFKQEKVTPVKQILEDMRLLNPEYDLKDLTNDDIIYRLTRESKIIRMPPPIAPQNLYK